MAQEGVGGLQDTPNSSFLMRVEGYGRTGSRQGQMIAVKGPNADVVKLLIVLFNQPFPALIVLPNPLGETLLDLLLFLAGGFGGRRVDNSLIAVIGMRIVNCRSPQIKRIFDQVDGGITRGAPFGGIGDGTLGLI